MIYPYYNAADKITYWTHSSFIPEDKMTYANNFIDTRKWYRNYIAIFGGFLGFKLTAVQSFTKLIPSRVHLLAIPALTFLLAFEGAHFAFVSGERQKIMNKVLTESTIPLWKSKLDVVNLQRIFFHIDQMKNYSIDVLHHGLTAENAQRIFPDIVKGTLPSPPKKYSKGDHHGEKHHH